MDIEENEPPGMKKHEDNNNFVHIINFITLADKECCFVFAVIWGEMGHFDLNQVNQIDRFCFQMESKGSCCYRSAFSFSKH